MDYKRLRLMKQELTKKENRSKEEQELLSELISLSAIIDKTTFSLSMSSGVCSACGRKL